MKLKPILLIFALMFGHYVYSQTPPYFKGGGTGGNTIPMNTSGSHTQQIYEPLDFNSIPISGLITKVYFRNTAAGASGTYTDFSVSFLQNSMTAFPSTTFLTGFTNALTASSITINGNATAAGWYEIPLAVPFLYDSLQTLIVEIKYTSKIGGMSNPTSTATGNKRLSIINPPGPATGNLSTIWGDFGIEVIPTTPCSGAPIAGTTIASAVNLCSGASVNLNLSGATIAAGLSYQWQSGPTATGPWTDILNDTLSYNSEVVTVDTYFRCKVTCSGQSDFSAPVLVNAIQPVSGSFTINSALPTGSGNFQTFNDAVASLSCGISGPVQFNVALGSGPYNEQINIPEITGTSSNNTITFNGNGSTISFSPPSSAERHVIRLSGADYVTFDNLIVTGIGATNAFAVHITNNSDYNVISNCTINGSTGGTGTTLAGIVISGSNTSATTAGSNCENNTIINNTVSGGYYGISSAGTATVNSNNQIINNIVLDFYLYGIYLTDENGVLIAGNDISRPSRSSVSTFSAIYLTGGTVNTQIRDNKIHNGFGGDLASTSASNGININSSDATLGNENVVFNNLIYNINGKGVQTGLFNTGSNYVLCYHNTVVLDDTASNTAITRGIYQTTTASGLEFKNNIIVISRAGTGAKHCVYLNASTTTGILDHNNYLMTSTGGTANNIGYLTASHTTILDWQTAVSQDLNSTNLDPQFVNPSLGNLTPSNNLLDNTCLNVGIANDANGVLRSPSNPDVGAIEFGTIPCSQPMGLNAINITFSGADIFWDTIIGVLSYEYTLNQVATAPTVSGTAISANSYSASGLSPNTTYYFHIRTDCGNLNLSSWATYSFTTACAGLSSVITPLGSTTVCDGDAVILNANSGANYTYQWKYNNNTIAGATDSVYLATVAGDYTLDVSNSPGCTTTSSIITISINSLPPTVVNAPVTSICVSGSVSLSANTAAGNRYQWFSGNSALNNDTLSNLSVSGAGNFRVLITDINGCSDTSAFVQVNLFDPQILSVTNDTICGVGSASLSAIASSGSSVNWYANQTGGTSIGTGNTFNTPSISSTTTYYASAGAGSSTIFGGKPAPVSTATGYSAGTLAYGLVFDAIQPFTLNSVEVYSSASAGNLTMVLADNTGSIIQTIGPIAIPAGTGTTIGGGATPTTIPINVAVPAGNGYRLYTTNLTATLIRENTGGYPYPLGAVGNVSTSWTSGSPSASNYYFFYNWSISVGCEGPRVPVTATSISAPSITGSSNISSICSGNNATLSVSSSNANYTYTWSPNNQTGSSVTVNPTIPTEYIVTAIDNSTGTFAGCTNVDTVSVNVQPTISSIDVNQEEHCLTGSSVLTLNPSTGYSTGSVEWQTSTNNSTYTVIAGANGVDYTTPTLTSTTYYKAIVKDANGATCNEMIDSVMVNNPQLLSTTAGESCGPNSVVLAANTAAGTTVNWYTTPTGGAPFNTGNTFNTPFIFNSTTYYAAASTGGGSEAMPSPSIGTGTFITPNVGWGLRFTANQPFSLQTVTIRASSTTPANPATIQLRVTDLTDVVLYTGTLHSFNLTSTLADYVIPVNISIPAPGNYKLTMTYSGISTIVREISGVSFPFNSLNGAASITAGANGVGAAQTTAAYYWFYNWVISTGCESARVPVEATIFDLPTVSLGNDTSFCDNTSLNLDAGNHSSYTWSTGANTQSISVNTSGTYSVIVTDTNACSNTDSIAIVANPSPNPVLGDLSNCTGQAETLDPGVSPIGNSFNWSSGQNTPTISVNTSGTYIVTVTNDGSGCSGVDTAIVNINTAQAIGLSDAIVCDYNSITLTVPSSFTNVSWSTGATGNSVTIAGSSLPAGANNITINAIDANGCATTQTIVLTVDRCLSVSERANSNQIKVYPNPSSGKINIEAENISNAILEVIDLNGRVLLTQKLGNDVKLHNVDLTGASSGMYFLKITGDGFQNVERITIR